MVPVTGLNSDIMSEQMKRKDSFEKRIANLRRNKDDCSATDRNELIRLIRAVGYPTFLAVVRSHNSLGPVLLSLAAKGHVNCIGCILHQIEPGDRKAICRLTGDGKRTILHLAATHGQVGVIRLVNGLFEKIKDDWMSLAALPDASGSTALDYAARKQRREYQSISEALLQGLTRTDQHKLIGESKMFPRVASKGDLLEIMEQANSSAGNDTVGLTAEMQLMKESMDDLKLKLARQAQELEQLQLLKNKVEELEKELQDMRYRCVYLPNGKPATADASCGSDDSPNTFTLFVPQDDSGSSESGSTSRTTSSDDLPSQDVPNPSFNTGR